MDAPKKPIVLFVHGFSSSKACWQPLLKLLRADPQITTRYELATWDYPTKWLEINFLGRIPRLQEIGRALGDELDSPQYREREVTLVGHSQGGLVIQTYFARMVEQAKANRLRNIRQAIFLATPCAGSNTGMSLRVLASSFFHNPQELTLRVLNPEIADIRERVRERIVGATRDSATEWRVPIHAVCGLQDNIVPEASARGVFDSVKSIEGNHFTIHCPADAKDKRYTEFVEYLLDPGGHTHRFEVERYENFIRVEPRPRQTITTASEKNSRVVEFDNYATLNRRVRFAPANRCRDPFTISYATRKDGYVVGHPSHDNEASVAERGRAEDTGTFYRFDFSPVEGEEYALDLEIYNGFRAKETDVHFHPGSYNSRLRELSYELDLSAYLAAGYELVTPKCFVQTRDVEHSDLCRKRIGANACAPVAAANGVYRWEFRDVQPGVVDLVWELAGTEGAADE